MANDLEFYQTPAPFTRYLFRSLNISGTILEPCVGDGAIVRDSEKQGHGHPRVWLTNDLDTRWPADAHFNATTELPWFLGGDGIDWTVSNPPFTPALSIIERAIERSRIGVAMHLRASIHEVLKTGRRRTWMNEFPPTGLLWLPRFAYQRSPNSGKWSTDSVCACWVVWMKEAEATCPQFIRYAPTWVLDELERETPAYRRRMDELMGFTGSETQRQQQAIAKAAAA